jgi:nitrate/nitrite transporter NarK
MKANNVKRYTQFLLLILAGGAIYPLIYLRQNYETAILHEFLINKEQLNDLYSYLGVIYLATYIPSGWLADRINPKLLISFSLFAVASLGFWFSTFPTYDELVYIFIGWGLAAGLTFWASLLKGVKVLAKTDEQGRFFGILDGGRGLVEALLASIAIFIFKYFVDGDSRLALQNVILLYVCMAGLIACLIAVFLPTGTDKIQDNDKQSLNTNFKDFSLLLSNKSVWLMAFIIFSGYQLFWATYDFSSYLQSAYGVTEFAAASLIVAKLWTRPVAAIAAGFLADKFPKDKLLAFFMCGAAGGLLLFVFGPHELAVTFLLGLVIFIGAMTYATRGIYWSLLDNCRVPVKNIGMAIGLISIIGYLPDIWLPKLNKWLITHFDGTTASQLYFSYIALCGVLGVIAAVRFKQLDALQNKAVETTTEASYAL